MKNKSVCVVILTYNESIHLRRCVESVKSFASDIVVVDSFSTDSTESIASDLGVRFFKNKWESNYSRQFNWALDNCEIKSDWVVRLDADEFFTSELATEVFRKIESLPPDVSGISVRRRIHFMGQWMRRGGTYPMWVLRIWRNGHGRCENRWMDEHIQLSQGSIVKFESDIVDDNKNDLTWWIGKHNNYATREAADMLNIKYKFWPVDARQELEGQAFFKRFLKEMIYAKIPLFLRPAFYFCFRYFFLFGFLDGARGFIWNFMQGWWYRTLVDAKFYEADAYANGDSVRARDYVEQHWKLR